MLGAEAAPGLPHGLELLACVAALALGVAVLALSRVSALATRHEGHEKAVEQISRRLEEIRENGMQQKELLHLLIKGHVDARRD